MMVELIRPDFPSTGTVFILLLFGVMMTCPSSGYSQSTAYSIESYQGSYEPLRVYNSIALLTEGDPLWEYEFELEFPFPFYDSSYSVMYFEQDAWGAFTDTQDLSLFLMKYFTYTYDNLIDTMNITSDVRFAHLDINGLRAFGVEFTKARFFADPFADSLDTYLNFQLWFVENGVIEVHFGEMHMDGNPIYEPGVGFYEYTTSGGVDTTYVAGPRMSIANPYDESDAIGLNGSYDDYDVVGDLYTVLNTLPPVGWVIRFVPEWVSAVSGPSRYEQVSICPNPASAYIRLPEGTDMVSVVDAAGRHVYRGQPGADRLDISGFMPGMYVVQYAQGGRVRVGRFVRM